METDALSIPVLTVEHDDVPQDTVIYRNISINI